MESVRLRRQTHDDSTGIVRGIMSDGREVLLQFRQRGLSNLTDGSRVHPDDWEWDRGEVPLTVEDLRGCEVL